jgi:subtilisin
MSRGDVIRGMQKRPGRVDKRNGLRRLSILLVLQAVLVTAAPFISHAQGPEGRYIVVLKNGTDPDAKANEHARRYGLTKRKVYRYALTGYSATIPASRVDQLRADPDVESVSPDRAVRLASQTIPTGVRRIRATSAANTNKGTGVNVAIVDTGIDVDHPDLAANIVGGTNCADGSASNFNDVEGHGTHVAGIVAALDNSIGTRGVAPEAKLWGVRVFPTSGNASFENLACGVDFVDSKSPARGGPITVLNMSVEANVPDTGNCGDSQFPWLVDPLHQAICRVVADGVTVVVAAGNGSTDVKNISPAGYDEVITATALSDSDGLPCGLGGLTSFNNPDDTFAYFSNYATTTADEAHTMAAPGDDIYSTLNGAPPNDYGLESGTSMASPHIAGAAALYIKLHPGTTPAGVLAGLKAEGEEVNFDFNGECGGGSSHTDPSTQHPELLVAVPPTIFTVIPPSSATAPVGVQFTGAVSGLTESNLVLGPASGGLIPAPVTYDTVTHRATLQPTTPLVPGEHYIVTVAPAGSTPPTDANDDPLPETTRGFRGATLEQENSVWAHYYWRSVATNKAYGGALVEDRFAGATATFSFTGSSISWYSMRGPDQGLARVEIDGVDKGDFDNYRSSAQYLYRRSWSVAAGNHKIKIVALGKKNSHATNTYANIDAFTVGATLNKNPTLQTTWHAAALSIASGARYTHDNTGGASVFFHFRGTRIDWRTILGPDQGVAKVYVDGVLRGTFDNYATTTKVAWRSFPGMTDGIHDIRVLVAGTKRTASKNTTVSVDCFLVI